MNADLGPVREPEEEEGESQKNNMPIKWRVVRLSDVESKPIDWLWDGHVPAGSLTALVGPRGTGKSLITYDIVARVTRGAPWPDDASATYRAPGSVLYVAAEDPTPADIAAGLEAAGADMTRVLLLSYPRSTVTGTSSECRPSLRDGTRSDSRPSLRDGTSSDSRPSPRDGTSSDSRPSPRDGTPSDSRPSPRDGTRSDGRPSLRDGRPSDSQWSLAERISRWELVADDLPDLRLIVINPLVPLLGSANDFRKRELEQLLYQLRHLAHERNLALLIINATDKLSAGKSWKHGVNVIDHLWAKARTVWETVADRPGTQAIQLVPTLFILGPKPRALRYVVDPAARRVVWVR